MASSGLRIARTDELSPAELTEIKRLIEESYREPFVEDWDHALGGTHFIVEENREPVSHASVVERRLEIGERRLRTGYVEAVATRPDRQRVGLASLVMRAVTEHIRSEFELGALSTGENDFYARFGWETWHGPAYVRTGDEMVRTADEDGNVMILRTPSTPRIDLLRAISCDWRTGDVW